MATPKTRKEWIKTLNKRNEYDVRAFRHTWMRKEGAQIYVTYKNTDIIRFLSYNNKEVVEILPWKRGYDDFFVMRRIPLLTNLDVHNVNGVLFVTDARGVIFELVFNQYFRNE